MSKLLITLAFACLAVGAVWAEDTTETAKMAASNPMSSGSADGKMAGRMMDRMMEAYKAAGVSEEQSAKLKVINAKVMQARAKGEKVDTKAARAEREKVLTPEQNEKVNAYLQEHKVPPTLQPKAGEKPAETK